MGGQYYVGQRENRIIGGQRLLIEDIQTGGSQLPRPQGIDQGPGIHNPGPAGIHQDTGGFHFFWGLAGKEALGSFRCPDVDRDGVGLREQPVQLNELDSKFFGPPGAGMQGPDPNLHTDSLGQGGNLAADAAEADDSQGLAVELDHGQPGPSPRPQLFFVFRDSPGRSQQEGQGVLGHGDG